MSHGESLDQVQLLDEDYAPSLSQWYTRDRLARRIVEWAFEGVEPGLQLRIIEPSAGLGAFLRHIPKHHAVTAVEIDPRRVAQLRADLPHVEVIETDYLRWHDPRWMAPPRADLAIMNPPYENGADCAHIARALDHCARVVALLRSAALHGVDRWERIWSRAWLRRLAILARRPRFGGTQSGSPSGDYIIAEIVAHEHRPNPLEPVECTVEWWL